ncbi:heat shock 70 kDa protein 12A-like protein [Dinothrombium tinctorium]|uniref:Heat shock 70 kDa protein 12A-like protein n=1 Tax=Dinothrombium tinctorium TaxID=1965070 RepID=A0A3S4QLP4_9ACAR|nr:heat shock 70 kDa protein 12A-like protein [Dinothrombium tinctorium]RWS05008.1 heat shock 70 kDa protein 12A-like protein [Dinothrombium tinctorium]
MFFSSGSKLSLSQQQQQQALLPVQRTESPTLLSRKVDEGTIFGLYRTYSQTSKPAVNNRAKVRSDSKATVTRQDRSCSKIDECTKRSLIKEEQVFKESEEKCNSTNNSKAHLKAAQNENINFNNKAVSNSRSAVIVNEVMKNNGSKSGSNTAERKRAMLASVVVESRGKDSLSIEENDAIQQLERAIAEDRRRNLLNELSSKPNKPPRKDAKSASSGPPSIDQQKDNLVEEIILSPEASSKATNNCSLSPYSSKTLSVSTNEEQNAASVSSHNQTHFVVVAIDFGTTYSGYAFSFTRDPDNIHMMRKWDGGGDPEMHNHKTPTTLLLNPDAEFDSFGFAARDKFHSLKPKDAKNWFYFEKFKMTLHRSESLTRETQIKAANGKSLSALIVFAHALRYFKQHALQELSDQCGTQLLDEDVRWVVTVPAIWKQPAKQFMRNAAYEAGMASPQQPEQLLIALEPEAASIYCRRLRLNQLIPDAVFKQKRSLLSPPLSEFVCDERAVCEEKGTRYMVVDCGGGTVDITVHEIQDKQGSLKELHKATGGAFGSVGVDAEFEKLLENIFGVDFMDHFKTKLTSGFVDLMTAFEARKRSATTTQTTPSNISLPFSFINSYKKFKGNSIENAVKKYASDEITYCSNLGMLRLQPSLIQKLFQPITREIVQHIQSIILHPHAQGVSYLFLVGGFADSQILQQAIRKAFSQLVKVIIPQGVSLAILRGAVLFGLDPNIINVRRSRMTYGIGVLNRFDYEKHPLSKKIVRDSIEWCGDIFDKFVLVDQSIAMGDVVTRSYTPAKDGQRYTVLHIYCSDRDDVTFITDESVQRCGTLVLDLDSDSNNSLRRSESSASSSVPAADNVQNQRRVIQTKMIFGDTEIKVMAIDMSSGKTVRAEVDFLSQ